MNNIEGWKNSTKIMVILAHPDDPEFFMGATIARWVSEGHSVTYCLMTNGDKGGDEKITSEELARIRQIEQKSAANVLGVEAVHFLNYADGYLFPDLEKRKTIVKAIRKEKPDIVVTSDPTNLFPRPGSINHPDHRAAGQIVLDAVFPAVGNAMFFPELMEEGLLPHSVKELWLSLTNNPNLVFDVTKFWPQKIQALYEHKSQIGEKMKFTERMLSRRAEGSTLENPRFEERFFRNILV